MRIPVAHLHLHLVWPIFLILAFLICMYFTVVLLCISQMTNDVKHFSWFFPYQLKSSSCILNTGPLSSMQSTNIFSICSVLFVQFVSGCLIKNLSSSLTEECPQLIAGPLHRQLKCGRLLHRSKWGVRLCGQDKRHNLS